MKNKYEKEHFSCAFVVQDSIIYEVYVIYRKNIGNAKQKGEGDLK